MLDHFEPRDIRELAKKGRLLPNLLLAENDCIPEGESRTILCSNFFDPDLVLPEDGFDLVIGNPPWVSRGRVSDSKALRWCLSDDNPYLAKAPKPKLLREKYFQPAKQIAHAFMWKIPAHLSQNGRACL